MRRSTFAIAAAGLLLAGSFVTDAGAAATSFVVPGSWGVGDAASTYQEWDVFTATTGNTPDFGYVINPGTLSAPTVDATVPGFIAGSGNFYSFSTDYGFVATIPNYTGAAGEGTHIIIQTAASLNETLGVLGGTLRITDIAGNVIAGGENASALRHDVLFEGIVNSSFGPVTQREEIWEFYLPDYTGDFKIVAGVSVHSSFSELRVDTAISQSAYPVTAIPEPMSVALLGMGAMALLRRRVA